MNTPTNNVQVQVDEKIREIELECMPDLKKEGTKIGGINFTLQGWEHLKNKIAEALTQTRHQATEDTIDEAIATVINNSIPSNDQMNVVRALRKLKE